MRSVAGYFLALRDGFPQDEADSFVGPNRSSSAFSIELHYIEREAAVIFADDLQDWLDGVLLPRAGLDAVISAQAILPTRRVSPWHPTRLIIRGATLPDTPPRSSVSPPCTKRWRRWSSSTCCSAPSSRFHSRS